MKIGSMKEANLNTAIEIYLFDCRIAGLDPQLMTAYRIVLSAFTRFTGDIRVEELTPEHVRLYIANLSDGPNEGEEHTRTVIDQYAVIHEWIRWLCAQKFLTERHSNVIKPPRSLMRRLDTLLATSALPSMRYVLG